MSEPTRTIPSPNPSSDGSPAAEADAPIPAHQAAEERLDRALAALHDQVDERLRALITSVEDDLFAPLQSAAHEAAGIHEALVKTSHFEQPVDEVDAALRWKRVRDYRRDTVARVIGPLREQLAAVELGAALNERWRAFWDDLASLPSTLPVTITRAEPAALYAPDADDSTWQALRKQWVRARRRVERHAPASEEAARTQDVPLRQLAAYHLRMRLPDQLGPPEAALYQHFAQAVAAFERAVTTWTHRLLDAERHLNRPIDHLTEELAAPAASAPAEAASPEAPPSAAPPPDDALSPDAVWDQVSTEATALNDHLHAMAERSFDACPAAAYQALEAGWTDLEDDVAHAGSFLLDLDDRAITPSAPHDRSPDAMAHWPAWYEQAVQRLDFCRALGALRDASYAHTEQLLQALIGTSVQPLLTLHHDALERLRGLHDEVEQLFAEASSAEALRAPLQAASTQGRQVVDDDLVVALQEARLLGSLGEQLDAAPDAIDAFFEGHAGTFLLHALPPPDTDAIAPDVDTREIDLRAIAEEHFDAFLTDALRESLKPVHQRIESILAATKDIPRILQFNLEGAQEELSAPSDPDADPVAAARELALNGLARTIEAIDGQVQQAQAVLPMLAAAVVTPLARAWVDFHDRARVESRIREHLLELRTLVNRETQEATERAERRFRAARIRLKRALRLGRGRAEELVQMGRSAVGAGTFSEDAFLETLETLASIDRVLGDLPLVYRRLFSLRPVTDPSLLVGRQASLARVQRHVDQWARGLSNALVVTGHHGSGLTSFLNVVQRSILTDSAVHWITLDERLRSESAVAARVVRALNLRLSPADDGFSLNQVREHLLAQPRPTTPRVCIVEHLEHLLLRAVHGTKLATRALTFMSRTDSRILWIASISHHGWQLLDRAESAASGLVLRHSLTPLDRPALEALILLRHQRSGVQLQFDPPDEPNPLLRQRLRKAASDAARQDLLRAEYFDRLHAQCGSNIMLALFYWVRSVRLDEETMTMHVQPVASLDFSFLERFSMQHAFALKSLLDHASLTIEEYSEVAQVPPETSLELFESLGNALLIQPLDTDPFDAESPFATIEPSRRYRIRPLLVHPVMQYLRGKNILH